MKNISLLPQEIVTRRLAKRRQQQLILSATVVLILLIAVNLYLFAVNFLIMRPELNSLQSLRKRLESDIEVMQEYELLYEETTAAEHLVNSALGSTPFWSGLIYELGKNMPTEAWWSEVSAQYPKDGEGSISIKGFAQDHDNVAALLQKFHALDALEEIRCQVSTATEKAGRNLVQFTLEARMVTEPPDTAAAEGGG
jgi:Tfp pilus assembly protein PilN